MKGHTTAILDYKQKVVTEPNNSYLQMHLKFVNK